MLIFNRDVSCIVTSRIHVRFHNTLAYKFNTSVGSSISMLRNNMALSTVLGRLEWGDAWYMAQSTSLVLLIDGEREQWKMITTSFDSLVFLSPQHPSVELPPSLETEGMRRLKVVVPSRGVWISQMMRVDLINDLVSNLLPAVCCVLFLKAPQNLLDPLLQVDHLHRNSPHWWCESFFWL